MTEGINAFEAYIAVKLHFTTKYDYHKYNGSVKSKSKFDLRKDWYFFAKLERKYKSEIVNFFVSNFISSHKIPWIGSMLQDEYANRYDDWKRRMESLTYNFELEMVKLSDTMDPFKVKDGKHPYALKELMSKRLSPESLLCVEMLSNRFLLKYWEEKIDDTFVWPEYHRRLVKYYPFLNLEEKRPQLKKIFGNVFKNQ